MPVRFQRVASSEKTLLGLAYRLRFIVYCLESGYEDPDGYPEGLEQDEYDQHSIHFVALNNTGVIGTLRLILNSPAGFPIEKHCVVNPRSKKFPRHQIAEISRLAVFRMWRCPAVTLGLMREVYRESKKLGIRFWYAAMEPKLDRLLRRYNLRFNQVGPMVDYHGQRIPFLGRVEKIEAHAAACDPERFGYFTHGLSKSTCADHFASALDRAVASCGEAQYRGQAYSSSPRNGRKLHRSKPLGVSIVSGRSSPHCRML